MLQAVDYLDSHSNGKGVEMFPVMRIDNCENDAEAVNTIFLQPIVIYDSEG